MRYIQDEVTYRLLFMDTHAIATQDDDSYTEPKNPIIICG